MKKIAVVILSGLFVLSVDSNVAFSACPNPNLVATAWLNNSGVLMEFKRALASKFNVPSLASKIQVGNESKVNSLTLDSNTSNVCTYRINNEVFLIIPKPPGK